MNIAQFSQVMGSASQFSQGSCHFVLGPVLSRLWRPRRFLPIGSGPVPGVFWFLLPTEKMGGSGVGPKVVCDASGELWGLLAELWGSSGKLYIYKNSRSSGTAAAMVIHCDFTVFQQRFTNIRAHCGCEGNNESVVPVRTCPGSQTIKQC